MQPLYSSVPTDCTIIFSNFSLNIYRIETYISLFSFFNSVLVSFIVFNVKQCFILRSQIISPHFWYYNICWLSIIAKVTNLLSQQFCISTGTKLVFLIILNSREPKNSNLFAFRLSTQRIRNNSLLWFFTRDEKNRKAKPAKFCSDIFGDSSIQQNSFSARFSRVANESNFIDWHVLWIYQTIHIAFFTNNIKYATT